MIVADNLANWNLGNNWTIEWWQKIPEGIDGFLSVLCQDANVPAYTGIDVYVNAGVTVNALTVGTAPNILKISASPAGSPGNDGIYIKNLIIQDGDVFDELEDIKTEFGSHHH